MARALEPKIDYKDSEQDISRYLGAMCSFEGVDPQKNNGAREVVTDVDNYVACAVTKFETEFAGRLSKVASAYLPPE